MKKYRFKWWYLVVGIVLVLVVDGQYHFLGSIVPGQGKDFVFSHFAWAENEDGYLKWTPSAYFLGDVEVETSRVGYDGCADVTVEGGKKRVCKGDSFMIGDNVKVVFNPVLTRTSLGGYNGG